MTNKGGQKMITIQKDKCIGCLACVDKCLCRALVPNAEDGRPEFVLERGCIKCMHCAAACPQNAILFDGESAISNEEIPAICENFADNLQNFLLERRSYRNFKDTPVPMSEIRHALEVAAWAPSAKNQHPAKYYVVNGKEKVQQIMDIITAYLKETGERPEILPTLANGSNMVVADAPTLILAYSRNNANRPMEDVTLALGYAEMVLQSRGIGTCWGGYLQYFLNKIDVFKEMFPLPDNNSFYGTLLVGYPTEEYLHIPKRLKQADIKEL